jgi:hypothetical protein
MLVLLAGLPIAVWLDLSALSDAALQRQAGDLNSIVTSMRGYYASNIVGDSLACCSAVMPMPVSDTANYTQLRPLTTFCTIQHYSALIAISSIGSARDYAAEELGAAFLRAESGFDGDVRRLHRDLDRPVEVGQRAFFAACSKVSKAADYLRDLALAEPFRTWSRVNRISVMPITARKQRLL